MSSLPLERELERNYANGHTYVYAIVAEDPVHVHVQVHVQGERGGANPLKQQSNPTQRLDNEEVQPLDFSGVYGHYALLYAQRAPLCASNIKLHRVSTTKRSN